MRAKRPRRGDGTGLLFSAQELVLEVLTLKKVARRFLDPATIGELDGFVTGLERVARMQGGSRKLELRRLQTVTSEGAYEKCGRRGRHNIHARITGAWGLRAYGGRAGVGGGRQVEFCGLASTKIELLEASRCLAMWRFELGAPDAPGCYFHAQILGGREDPPFPSTLPVPRLPSVFVTPMAAIEYVLGELFQDEWEREVSGKGADQWRRLQRDRLRRLLDWQQKTLDHVRSSPWMTLKAAVFV